MIYKNSIELLAPAGSIEALESAIGEGADAVYIGLKDFNARLRAKNFSYRQFEAIVEKLHSLKKKIYVTLNTVFEARDEKKIYNLLKYLWLVKPDAVIIQDYGILKLVKEFFPGLKLHASTQMNINSAKGANLLAKNGVQRIVLSRELSFNDIKGIRNKTNAELEVFIHGALCISLSGACLFSSYFGGKSANRGLCVQPCRKLYDANNKSGYFFSTNDLMLIEFIPDLIDTGINSIKIEGRMRGADYVASVVKAYRYVIDNYNNLDKKEVINTGISILKNDFARNKTKYYFFDKKNDDLLNPDNAGGTGIFLGKIKNIQNVDNTRMGYIETKIDININDTIRIQNEKNNIRESIKLKKIAKKDNGICFFLPEGYDVDDNVFLINKKELSRKYPGIIPRSLEKYKRHPGNSDIPYYNKEKQKSNESVFKQGFYVKINNFKDIYLTQSVKPAKLILDFTKYNLESLSKNQNISYKPSDIILYMDPFLPFNTEEWLEDQINKIIKKGYKNFIINNPGHFSLLKNKDLNLICGPYLYTFNRFSINFILSQDINYFIFPIESNKKNIYDSTSDFNRNNWFVTVFSCPELFQIQNDALKKYNFKNFSDKFNNNFNLNFIDDKTVVTSGKPYSIVDKIPQLKKSGFSKFILDFSYYDLKKNIYKNIMKQAMDGFPLKDTTRFNWKEGFFFSNVL